VNKALHWGLGALALLLPTLPPLFWVHSAEARLADIEAQGATAAKDQVAVASASDEGYCSANLKKVLRRVLQSCGLLSSGEVRGCQPLQTANLMSMVGDEQGGEAPKTAKQKAKAGAIAGDDFNALFLPLADRAGIIQFDKDSVDLDAQDLALVDKVFADQRGASYFFVVARASPEGSVAYNRDLSQRRGQAVLDHLRTTFNDPDLDKEVGLLWLGEEFAQLDQQFCAWQRSGTAESCSNEDLNRSAFIAWIDCRL